MEVALAETPQKIEILNNLKTVLEGIDGNDPYHYAVNVLDIGSNYEDIGSTQFPAVLINEWPEGVKYRYLSTDFQFTTEPQNMNLDKPGYEVLVSTFIKKGSESDNLLKRYLKHERDIIYAVGNNNTLNGNCNDSFPYYRRFYKDWDDKSAVLDIIFAINYDFRPKSNVI